MLKSIRLEDQIIFFFFFFKCFIFPRVICCYNSSQLESCSSLFYSRLCLVRLTQRIGSAPMVNLVSAGGSEHTFRPARQRRCLLISPQRLCNVTSSPSFSYKWVSKNGSWSTGAGTVPQLSVGGVRLCDSQNHRIDLAPLPHCPSQILLHPPLKCFFSPPLFTAITALVPRSLPPECLQSTTCPWSLWPPSSPYNNSLNPIIMPANVLSSLPSPTEKFLSSVW